MNDMAAIDVDDFSQEKECIHEGERYSVRDNGAVFRHQRDGKRARSNDNQWTFGKENQQTHIYISRIFAFIELWQPLFTENHLGRNM